MDLRPDKETAAALAKVRSIISPKLGDYVSVWTQISLTADGKEPLGGGLRVKGQQGGRRFEREYGASDPIGGILGSVLRPKGWPMPSEDDVAAVVRDKVADRWQIGDAESTRRWNFDLRSYKVEFRIYGPIAAPYAPYPYPSWELLSPTTNVRFTLVADDAHPGLKGLKIESHRPPQPMAKATDEPDPGNILWLDPAKGWVPIIYEESFVFMTDNGRRWHTRATKFEEYGKLADGTPYPTKWSEHSAPAVPHDPLLIYDIVERLHIEQKAPEAFWFEPPKEEALEKAESTTAGSRATTQPIARDPAVTDTPHQSRLLLVTDGNYFLERAIRSLGPKAVILSPAQFEAAGAGDATTVFFDRYAPVKLPATGNFIFIGVTPPGEALTAVDLDGKQMPVKGSRVKDWRREHPALRDIDLRKVYVDEGIKLESPAGWDALVDGPNAPLIVSRHEPGRNEVVIGFDVLKSNWPLKPSFPVFLFQCVSWLDGAPADPHAQQRYFDAVKAGDQTPATHPAETRPVEPAKAEVPAAAVGGPSTRPASPFTAFCRDASGKPVVGAEVYVAQAVYLSRQNRQPVVTAVGPFLTRADGVARVTGLPVPTGSGVAQCFYARLPGKHVGGGYRTWKIDEPVSSDPFPIAMVEAIDLHGTVTLPKRVNPREVSIRLRNFSNHPPSIRDRAVEGFQASFAEGLWPERFTRHPDADGSFVFADVPAEGRSDFVVTGPGLASLQWMAPIRAGDWSMLGARAAGYADLRNIRLEMDAEGFIEGTLFYPGGIDVVPDANIVAVSNDGWPPGERFLGKTDRTGQFRIGGLPGRSWLPGRDYASFSLGLADFPEGWTMSTRAPIAVRAGQTTTETLMLRKGVIVHGAVVDQATGKGLAGAWVVATNSNTGSHAAGLQVADIRTAESGEFQLRLPAGSNQVVLREAPEGYGFAGYQSPMQVIDVAADENPAVAVSVDFKLIRGAKRTLPPDLARIAAEAANPAHPATQPSDQSRRLVPGDLLTIGVEGLNEADLESVKPAQVEADGTVRLFSIKEPIRVRGLTPAEVEVNVIEEYRKAKIVAHAIVRVRLLLPAGAESVEVGPIGQFDLVRIGVVDLEVLGKESVRIQRVDADGMIQLPYIGRQKIAGLTGADAEKALIAEFRRKQIVQKAQVSVVRLEAAPKDAEKLNLSDKPLKPLPRGMESLSQFP